jgi:hypothetical protein
MSFCVTFICILYIMFIIINEVHTYMYVSWAKFRDFPLSNLKTVKCMYMCITSLMVNCPFDIYFPILF